MAKKENTEKGHLTPADLRILAALQEASDGLRITQLSRAAKVKPTYLRRRLLKLRLAYLVKRGFKSKQSSQVIYKQTNIMASSKDLELVDIALERFFSIKKIDSLVNRIESNAFKDSEKRLLEQKILKREYSGFYPYYLWCILHASQAESKYIKIQIIRFYLFWIKNSVNNVILSPNDDVKIFYQGLNEASFPALKNELSKRLFYSKRKMISLLPESKQELASALFDFWSQSANPSDILEFLNDLASNKVEKERFGKYYKQFGFNQTKDIKDIILLWTNYLNASPS